MAGLKKWKTSLLKLLFFKITYPISSEKSFSSLRCENSLSGRGRANRAAAERGGGRFGFKSFGFLSCDILGVERGGCEGVKSIQKVKKRVELKSPWKLGAIFVFLSPSPSPGHVFPLFAPTLGEKRGKKVLKPLSRSKVIKVTSSRNEIGYENINIIAF